MNDSNELTAVIDAVISALRRHEIPYYVTGSFASSVHGEFRATADIDLVAAIEPAVLPALMREWDLAFVADAAQALSALASGTSFNLIHRTTYLKVDFFPCDTAFNRSALDRAVTIQVPGAAEALRVSSLEDILLAKLRWYRLGGESSAVQRRDVRQLVELNRGTLDVSYLRHWSAVLGVEDLLTTVLE
jgi:hypothetical protein